MVQSGCNRIADFNQSAKRASSGVCSRVRLGSRCRQPVPRSRRSVLSESQSRNGQPWNESSKGNTIMTAYRTYKEYLLTPEFHAVRSIVRHRSSGICEDCHNSVAVDIHHVAYCRWGEFDTEQNLLDLCRPCHEGRHKCTMCCQISLKASEIKRGKTICPRCSRKGTT